jgi:hypothetical protein
VVGAVKAANVAAKKANLPATKILQAEKRAADVAAEKIKHEGGYGARDLAVEIGKSAAKEIAGRKPKTGPDVGIYIAKLIDKCETANPYGEISKEVRRLIPFVYELNPELCKRLAVSMKAMAKRSFAGIDSLADAFLARDKKQVIAYLEGETECSK